MILNIEISARGVFMNMNNLYYFHILSRYQHYTKAAEYLFMTQPSLSHAISTLEKEYGVRLFVKDGRNVRLSKYGALLKEYTDTAFSALDQGNRLLSQFASFDKGFVDFGFLLILGYNLVPELIQSFHEIHENENITVNMRQCSSAESIEQIRNGSLDLAMCTHVSKAEDVKFLPLYQQELVCIVARDHPLARFDEMEIRQLAGFATIQYTGGVGEIQDIITRMYESCNIRPQVYLRFQEEFTIAGFISTGLGGCTAIVPDLELLDSFPIKKIRIRHPDAKRTIYLASSIQHPMPYCVQTFRNYIQDFFASRTP